MNREQLIGRAVDSLAAQGHGSTGSKATVARHLKALLEEIALELRNGGEVRLAGLGTFRVVERAARVGRNPKTKEAIAIPAKRTVRFRPAKGLGEKKEYEPCFIDYQDPD